MHMHTHAHDTIARTHTPHAHMHTTREGREGQQRETQPQDEERRRAIERCSQWARASEESHGRAYCHSKQATIDGVSTVPHPESLSKTEHRGLSRSEGEPPHTIVMHRRPCPAAHATPPTHRRSCPAVHAPPPQHRCPCTDARALPPMNRRPCTAGHALPSMHRCPCTTTHASPPMHRCQHMHTTAHACTRKPCLL